MEEIAAFSELAKQGWKPKRTIIYWLLGRAEEPGLLDRPKGGDATPMICRNTRCLHQNSGGNSRGFLQASGSHTLETLSTGVMKDIQDLKPADRVGTSAVE